MGYRPKYICNCPFYEYETEKRIFCEGIDSAAGNIMTFNSEEEKNKFIVKNCVKCMPGACKLFELLTEKYLYE